MQSRRRCRSFICSIVQPSTFEWSKLKFISTSRWDFSRNKDLLNLIAISTGGSLFQVQRSSSFLLKKSIISVYRIFFSQTLNMKWWIYCLLLLLCLDIPIKFYVIGFVWTTLLWKTFQVCYIGIRYLSSIIKYHCERIGKLNSFVQRIKYRLVKLSTILEVESVEMYICQQILQVSVEKIYRRRPKTTVLQMHCVSICIILNLSFNNLFRKRSVR